MKSTTARSKTPMQPYGVMRLHESCCNFAILQQTPDFELYYRCNVCDLNLHACETISMEEYLAREQGEEVVAPVDKTFLPYQIVTFTKKKEVETPIVANEFIAHDKTNHRETYFCDVCKCDKSMILIPNSLKDLSFKRICDTCRTIS